MERREVYVITHSTGVPLHFKRSGARYESLKGCIELRCSAAVTDQPVYIIRFSSISRPNAFFWSAQVYRGQRAAPGVSFRI